MIDKPKLTQEIPSAEELISILRQHAHTGRCGIYLHQLDDLQRQSLYQELETERLNRKCVDIKELFAATRQNWTQVMFIIFMRALSDERNRPNFMEIARRVDFNILTREKHTPESVEMILVGASGLLQGIKESEFTKEYRAKAEYLLHKYNITPLPARAWETKGLLTSKMPILRLSQVANLINHHDQLFNTMMHCKSREDLFNLFNVEASEVWCNYFKSQASYKIGRAKIDLIGINLIVPMLYTYGFYINDDSIIDTANDLNESIPAEDNRYVSRMRSYGLTPTSAFETQAINQLLSVYCKGQLCDKCHIFRHMQSSKSVLSQLPILWSR